MQSDIAGLRRPPTALLAIRTRIGTVLRYSELLWLQ